MQMCCLRTWFSGGSGSVMLMVGLDDLRDLLKQMILFTWTCQSNADFYSSSTDQVALRQIYNAKGKLTFSTEQKQKKKEIAVFQEMTYYVVLSFS